MPAIREGCNGIMRSLISFRRPSVFSSRNFMIIMGYKHEPLGKVL